MRGRTGAAVRVIRLWPALVAALVAVACSGGRPDDDDRRRAPSGRPTDPYAGHQSSIYQDPAHWLCHPSEEDDACSDLSATRVTPDGAMARSDLVASEEPGVDCFYVYPTVSTDPGLNSDLDAGDAERLAVAAQAAPFTSVCRMFAPSYRQVTFTASASGRYNDPSAQEQAYADVLDAWQTYISQHNDGRGVVLIGHSQGARHLVRLLTEEVAPNESLRNRLVSAILPGADVPVASDGQVFDGIDACRKPQQTGCVVAYVTYPRGAPPGADSFFGRTGSPGRRHLCVDPAALTARHGGFDTVLLTERSLIGSVDMGSTAETRYLILPDIVETACRTAGAYDFLEVGPATTPDRRNVPALLRPAFGAGDGLHVLDVNLTLGALLDLVNQQAAAHTTNR